MKKAVLILGILLLSTGGLFFWLKTPYRYLFQSNADLTSGKVARAVEVLQEGLKEYPDNFKINFNLAKGYLSLGEIEQANNIALKKKLINSLKENKNFQDFLVDLAESNKRLGNYKEAMVFVKQYLEYQDPNEVSKRIVRNYIRVGQLLPEKSLEFWEKAYNIANHLKETELKQSIKALLLPQYLTAVENLKINKKYDEALDILNSAEIFGKNAEVKYLKAIIYSELGKMDLACGQFEEALQIEPNNEDYRISYVNVLEKAALKTKDQKKRTEYSEKVKLLLASIEDNPKKASLLNKIINLNAKFKITNSDLTITKVGDYLYPSLVFKIKPVSDELLKKYRIVFLDQEQRQIDIYEAPFVDSDTDQLIEVTSRSPINGANLIGAKLFINDEFVKEYSNK